MNTFKIEIQEVLSRIIEIQAEDLDGAVDLANKMYQSEEIVLDYNDLTKQDIVPVDLRGEKDRLVKELIAYLYEDEKKHFEELDTPSEHIFLKLEQLKLLMDD